MGLIDRWDRDERASRVMTMIQVYKLIMILTTSTIQVDAMMVKMTDRVHLVTTCARPDGAMLLIL